MKEYRKMSWNVCSERKSNIHLYLVILTLLICSRLFDIYTTYLATPDLAKESNFVVRYLGLGWFILIAINIAIILLFFLLFRFSWSKLMKRFGAQHRNISLEIGITLPIYVIITGYFQGFVNLLIHLELIIFSFMNYLFLYPIIIGGIFGYISLFLTKRFLYLGHPRIAKKAHKIMIPKRTAI